MKAIIVILLFVVIVLSNQLYQKVNECDAQEEVIYELVMDNLQYKYRDKLRNIDTKKKSVIKCKLEMGDKILNWDDRKYFTSEEFQQYHEQTKTFGKGNYWNYVKGETKLHYEICKYLAELRLKFHHSPNEGKRNKFQSFLIGILGLQAGFPDLIIYDRQCKPFYLEVKFGYNVPTDNQLTWLKYFNDQLGARAFVVWTYEAAKIITDDLVTKGHVEHEFYLFENGLAFLKSDIIPTKIRKEYKL